MLVSFTQIPPDEVRVVFRYDPDRDTSTTVILKKEMLWPLADLLSSVAIRTPLEATYELTEADDEANNEESN